MEGHDRLHQLKEGRHSCRPTAAKVTSMMTNKKNASRPLGDKSVAPPCCKHIWQKKAPTP